MEKKAVDKVDRQGYIYLSNRERDPNDVPRIRNMKN